MQQKTASPQEQVHLTQTRQESLSESAEAASGCARMIGPYEVLEDLGCGNMGLVYKVRHSGADRIMAMKILREELAVDSINVKRFQQELKTTSLLTHPNIIPIYDSGVTEFGCPYFTMEYVDGASLEDILHTEGYLDLERFMQMFTQVIDALIHAHEKRVVHRDIKPSNIVISRASGEIELVKLLDFGIARVYQKATKESTRLTQLGEVVGTPTYMSPEQCLGQKLDFRSDIYSLGAVMYECLAGMPPFAGNNAVEVIMGHMQNQPKSLRKLRPDFNIPADLEALIMTCLEKQACARFQSAQELKDELKRCANSSGARRSFLNLKQAYRQASAQSDRSIRHFRKLGMRWKRSLKIGSLLAGGLLASYYCFFLTPQIEGYIERAQVDVMQNHPQTAAENWDKALLLSQAKFVSRDELANLYERAGDDIGSVFYKNPIGGSQYGAWEWAKPTPQINNMRSPEQQENCERYYRRALDTYDQTDRTARLRVVDKLLGLDRFQHDSTKHAQYLAQRIALAEDGADFSVKNARAYDELARIFEGEGKNDQAETMLKKALRSEQANSGSNWQPWQGQTSLADFYQRTANYKEEEAARRQILTEWQTLQLKQPERDLSREIVAAQRNLDVCLLNLSQKNAPLLPRTMPTN